MVSRYSLTRVTGVQGLLSSASACTQKLLSEKTGPFYYSEEKPRTDKATNQQDCAQSMTRGRSHRQDILALHSPVHILPGELNCDGSFLLINMTFYVRKNFLCRIIIKSVNVAPFKSSGNNI